MIMHTFFDTYDFSGKTIIPFNTHHGSGNGGTYRLIAELEPEATVLEGLALRGVDVKNDASRQGVKDWLAGLGYAGAGYATQEQPQTEEVLFENTDNGLKLAGIVFMPDGFDEKKQYPAIVVAGPMLSVKEQAQSIYAERLAKEGYVTMVFDYSYFGESEGEPRQLEIPDVKASDISSAVTYLQSLSYVDPDRIGGIGICGSGSYMPYAAIKDERIKTVASVVPATVLDTFIMMPLEQVQADKEAYEAGEAEPTYVDLMPRSFADGAAYYYNEERGLRDNWDSHAVSWSELDWADFHPTEFIGELKQPYLVITSENAWSREGAEQLYQNAVSDKEFYLVDEAGHFDMYDLESYVTEAVGQIVDFFGKRL